MRDRLDGTGERERERYTAYCRITLYTVNNLSISVINVEAVFADICRKTHPVAFPNRRHIYKSMVDIKLLCQVGLLDWRAYKVYISYDKYFDKHVFDLTERWSPRCSTVFEIEFDLLSKFCHLFVTTTFRGEVLANAAPSMHMPVLASDIVIVWSIPFKNCVGSTSC